MDAIVSLGLKWFISFSYRLPGDHRWSAFKIQSTSWPYLYIRKKQVPNGQFNKNLDSLVDQIMKGVVDGELVEFEACDQKIINCTISPELPFESESVIKTTVRTTACR